jgi:hypothetical protein
LRLVRRHPVRLQGVVRRGDEVVYSTADEPDRALMVRCGNRREACCPSCANEYRGDRWQRVYAGLAGGRKGVPESVAGHPQVFATPTAPSFGPVHTRPDDGRPRRCGKRHATDDPVAPVAAVAKTCSSGYEHAVVSGSHKCLRRGQFCARRYHRQYRRYGFRCVRQDARGNYHLS